LRRWGRLRLENLKIVYHSKLTKNNNMSLKNELKNPATLSVLSFALGIVIAAWGWDKNESTIAARTHGAIAMIVVGCIMILAGIIGMASVSNRRS
jgi:hypothetical protein